LTYKYLEKEGKKGGREERNFSVAFEKGSPRERDMPSSSDLCIPHYRQYSTEHTMAIS
jgi:hypothetical protein